MSLQIEACVSNSLFPPGDAAYKLESLYRIGTRLAAEKLSLFFLENLEAELTGFFFLPFPWLLRHLEEAPSSDMGAHSRISGDIKGEIYLRFPGETGMNFVRLRMKGWESKRKFFVNKVQESIISETANILINTFWSALQNEVPLHWSLTPPVVITDVSKSFKLAGKIYSPDRNVLLAEIVMYQPEMKLELIFIPAGEALNHFLSILN